MSTVISIAVIVSSLMTLYIFFLWLGYREDNRAVGYFLSGFIIVNIAYIILNFSGKWPFFLTGVFANTIFIGGYAIMFIAFAFFLKGNIVLREIAILIIITAGVLVEQIIFSYIYPSIRIRLILLSGATSFIQLFIAFLIFKYRKSLGTVHFFLIPVILIRVLSSLSSAVLAIFADPGKTIASLSWYHVITTVLGTYLLTFWPFGFAMMILNRKKAVAEERTREAGLLLRELHHRMNNNMSMIISLIDWQILRSDEHQSGTADVIKAQLSAAKARIHSQALVYQRLLTEGNLTRIMLNDFISSLSEKIESEFMQDDRNVRINLTLTPILVSIETAGYAGLILNELLANSFTHAFPDNKTGEINITLETKPDNNIFLTYSDNGPGAEKIKPGEFQGMGTELVQILGEQQLRGQMTMDYKNGFFFSLIFKNELPKTRI